MKAPPFPPSVLLSVLPSSTAPELPTQVAKAALGLCRGLTVLSAQSYFLSFLSQLSQNFHSKQPNTQEDLQCLFLVGQAKINSGHLNLG